MRRLTTWFLILALVLLGLCLVWLLPRLLREEPPPEQNIAASTTAEAPSLVGVAPTPAPAPQGPDPAASKSPTETSISVREAAARPSAEPAGSTSSLRGRVLDRAGKSVPGVPVLAAHAPDLGTPIRAEDFWISHLPLDVADPEAIGAETPARTTTDALGAFRFDAFEPGRVRLAVRSTRHAPLDRNDLRLGSGQDLDIGDLVLDAPAWIDGVLLDAGDRPVRKAPVVLSDALAGSELPALAADRGVRLAETEVRGRFRAGPVTPGPQRLHALGHPDFEDVAIEVPDAGAGGEYLATVPEADRITGQVLVRGAASGGLVVRALPAETARGPVPFDVRADARRASVQRNGAFEIEGLLQGTLYELRVGSDLDRFEDATVWSPPAFAAAGETGVRIRWGTAATIAFVPVDPGGAAVLGDCRVDFERALPARVVLAGAEGPREIGNVRPTTSSPYVGLLLQSRGYGPIARTVEIAPGSKVDLGSLEMRAVPRLLVHVVDAATREPVRGARVTATETPTGADASGLEPEPFLTDVSGDARVACFAGAASRVRIEASEFASATRLGPFGFGYGSPRLEVELVPGATARILVLDDNGDPIPGARVEWVEGDWTPPVRRNGEPPVSCSERPDPRTSRLTDAEGRVAFASLAPGRHAFYVQRRRPSFLDGEWTQRDLGSGEEQEIELRSRAPGSLDLRIVDGGLPLAGAPVCLLRAEDAARSSDPGEIENVLPPGIDARLDARGRLVLEGLDAPAVDVLAVLVENQARRACFQVRLLAGRTPLTLDVAASAVTGTVLDADRTPVAGAEIFFADEAREAELKSSGRRRTLLDGGASTLSALAIERPAARTDAEGRFRIVGLPLSLPFTLLARAAPGVARAAPGEETPSRIGRSESTLLRSGEGARDLEIKVAPAGAIVVRPRPGPDLGPCTLVATARFGAKASGTLPRIRRFYPGRPELLYGLAPGTWELEIVSDDRQFRDRLRVEVAAAEVRDVEL